jgi:hypothetical protein
MEQETKPRRPPMVPGPSGTQVTTTEQLAPHVGPLTEKPQLYVMPGPVGKIAKAIAGVMIEVGTIKKGGRNEFYGYDYARMEDLLQALTPLMGKHGLAILQNELDIQRFENRVAVRYEFTIIHESGEMWPPMRQTGMCNARTRKGEFDDKAILKCHTQARKYFLLSLFEVPAGDFEDNDADTGGGKGNGKETDRRVPGPAKREEGQRFGPGEKIKTPQEAKPATQEGVPHKITLGQGTTADQWASAYLRNIGKAKSVEELQQWDKLNDDFLQRISDRYSAIYDMIKTAFERRHSDLSGIPAGMPDPAHDAQESMNWVAGQLQQIKTMEALEAFWNSHVAPHESKFDQVDWGMLLGEFERNEKRLNPPTDEPEGEAA